MRLCRARATTSGVPCATIVPPSSPAPGPTSITQSLSATTRMSCSTTMTVLPGVDEPVQLRHEPVDVGGMQAGGRLVEDVQRVAALGALQLGRELDALRFAAGQLRRRLAEAQVAEADLPQDVNGRADRLVARKTRRPSSTFIASTSAMLLPR